MRMIFALLLASARLCLAQADYSTLLLLAPAVAGGGGGIAEVGSGSQRASGSGNGVGSAAAAFPGNVGSGRLLVAGGAAWGATDSPSSVAVTDTIGNTWTVLLGDEIGGAWRTFIAYTICGSAGANTVTVNPSGADANHTLSFSIDEFSGVNASSPLFFNDLTETGTSSNPSGLLSGVSAGQLSIAVMSHDGATMALTPITGTQIGENETNTSMQCHNLMFQVLSGPSGFEVWSTGASTIWGAQTAVFQP